MLESDNPLIKEILIVINIEDLRQQLQQQEEEKSLTPIHYQSKEEYQLESKGSPISLNEPENNQPSLPLPNLNNNLPVNMTFDTNAANVLIVALINLNITLAAEGEERKAVNYPSFNERSDEDINNFITELEKAFAVNRVVDDRKYLVAISCLKGIAANFYNRLAKITNWNTAGQAANIQLRSALIARFQSEAQATHYYNQYLALKQVPTQTINNYTNRFLELKKKVDSNNNMPVAHVVLKFVQELLLQLMTITYASNSVDLQTAINIAKRLEKGLSLTTQHQMTYSLEEK